MFGAIEGISAAAKARGAYKGRQPSIDAAAVLRLREEEKLGPAAIARQLGIGRASVYPLLGQHRAVVAARGAAGLRSLGPLLGQHRAVVAAIGGGDADQP